MHHQFIVNQSVKSEIQQFENLIAK